MVGKLLYPCVLLLILMPMATMAEASSNITEGSTYEYEYTWSHQITVGDHVSQAEGSAKALLVVEHVEGTNITYSLYMASCYVFFFGGGRTRGTVDQAGSLVNASGFTQDKDLNGYAEACHFDIAHSFFVNPDWGQHEAGWDSSVEYLRGLPCVEEVKAVRSPGLFSLRVKARVELDLDGDDYWERGFSIYNIEARFDGDGVLSRYSLKIEISLEEDISSSSELRINPYEEQRPAPAINLLLIAGLAVICLVAGLLIGFAVGRSSSGAPPPPAPY